MKLVFRIIVALIPLAGFVWVVMELQRLMAEGHPGHAFGWLFVALVALAVVEGVLVRFWVLPTFAQMLGERIYAGGYWPDADPLLVLVSRIRREKDETLLPQLEKAVLADAQRVRGWQEYAHVLQEVFGRHEEALLQLSRGATKVKPREDRPMLLCRAAHIASADLRDEARAQELYREAAERFPDTTYGELAASRLY